MASPAPSGNKIAPSVAPPAPAASAQATPSFLNDPNVYSIVGDGGIYYFINKSSGQQVGAINPATGKIYETPSGSVSVSTVKASDALSYLDRLVAQGKAKTQSFSGDTDYGLGADSKGIMIIGRDQNGSPTKYIVQTQGGGSRVVNDINEAKSLATSYKTWSDGQAAAKNPVVTTAPAATPTTQATPGQLTTPGYGEQNYLDTKGTYSQPSELEKMFQQNKDAYGQPSNAEKNYDATKGDYSQPSRAEQTWNGFAGKFNDTTALDDMYKRAEQSAQTTLSRKGSTGGWGGSGAAARATVNTSAKFADAKTSALSDWAKTGMSLASTADQGALARLGAGTTAATTADNSALTRMQQGMGAAGQADSGLLTRTTTGQSAATGAQNSMETRLTGGMKSALQIADSQAQTLSAGLDSATKSLFDSKMAALKAQMTAGTIDAQQYYDEANDLMAAAKSGAAALTAYKPKTK
jgi:hypothetical protein